jgi:isoquinoline 1-oxidoreductase beta subunit
MAAELTRRSLLVSAAALAGGVALRFEVAGAGTARSELTAWIVISPDETVVLRVARAEMGQGSATGLAMLVAEELACDWSKVRPEFVAAHENLARKRAWGDMSTGNSRSIRASQEVLRRAGATAREMLIAAAARSWEVPASECKAANGIVSHAPSGRRASFGELAAAAAQIAPPAAVPLKHSRDWTLLGTVQPRFDVPDKISGKPVYAGDVRLPDMLYAAIRQCPVFTGRVKSVDAERASAMPGVRRVVPLPAAVAVVADGWWQANQALDVLTVDWDIPAAARVSTDDLRRDFRAALDAQNPVLGYRRGDDAAIDHAVRRIEAEYEVPYLPHATMEPQNCTAWVTPDKVEVWAPTQSAEATLVAAASAAGVPASKVLVHPVMLGGGFGRRGLMQDFVTQAVLIAKEVGRPVQLIWSREEDIRHDFYRPLVLARLAAGLGADGMPVAWTVRLAGQSLIGALAPTVGGVYRQFFEGFVGGMAYAVPNLRVDYVVRRAPVPVGYWRGVNDTQNAFFKECFIDEMAEAAGQDPYRYRRRLLAAVPRHLAVLDAAAQRAGWDGPAGDGIFRGIATHAASNTICAQVVEISLGAEGVRVHRVVAAIDPGHVVDPRSIEMQTEGAIAFALGAALYGEITVLGGAVAQSNFHDCRMLRMSEMPRVETVIVPSGGVWGGVGEPPVLPLAPALCNAVFAATGRRIRALPIKTGDLRKA